MKRVRCPKCDQFITFDETRYENGQSLIFECPSCCKQFGIKIGISKLRNTQKEDNEGEHETKSGVGSIIVIENVFHFKQVIPLKLGENVIGRYMKGSKTNTPIETVDPSIDMTHCIIHVKRDKKGKLQYILRDGPSNTGTFVDNEILKDKERRIIQDGTLFTIGATSIILHGKEESE
ncbi:FHA domain-containing protein [Bacteroides heparinolyticus]|uniref:FHA domain-containing protein n=1 Tax=Prevotella heparinolytica TaxID=28113 RepID=UPI002A9FE941|nr:FHA domain-containing protein [Prevotella sp.]